MSVYGDNFPEGVSGYEEEIAGNQDWERCVEDLDCNLAEYLVEDNGAASQFTIFILDRKKADMTIDKLIDLWLKTDEGDKFYAAKLQWLYETRESA